MRRVSSRIPIVVHAGWSLCCIVGAVAEWLSGSPWMAIFAMCVLVGLWFLFRRVPVVRLGQNQLQVARGSVVATMDLSNVKSASSCFLCGYDVVTVSLHEPASFGDSFWFVATTRVRLLRETWLNASPHPVVKELRPVAPKGE